MYGSGAYRPLHHPEPRRRDRAAGARSERRAGVLLGRSGGGSGRRPRPEKRRALRRLLARFEGRAGAQWLATALGIALVGLLAVGVVGTVGTADPRPFPDAPGDYARLAGIVAASCAEGTCGFGNRIGRAGPPAEAMRLMSRLRVRGVFLDRAIGRTTFTGTAGASYRVVYDAPAAVPVTALRAVRDAELARWRPASLEVVEYGGGWRREPGR